MKEWVFDSKLQRNLSRLSILSSKDEKDVLVNAIALYKIALEEGIKGGVLYVERPDGSKQRIVL